VAAAASAAPAATQQQQPVYDAVVVGGGLSGLVAGQALAAKHGIRNFLVTEARDRVGGNITSLEGNGFVWEEGPNSFQPNDAMLQIAVGGQGWAEILCAKEILHVLVHARMRTCTHACSHDAWARSLCGVEGAGAHRCAAHACTHAHTHAYTLTHTHAYTLTGLVHTAVLRTHARMRTRTLARTHTR